MVPIWGSGFGLDFVGRAVYFVSMASEGRAWKFILDLLQAQRVLGRLDRVGSLDWPRCLDVLDCAAAVAALFAELIEGNVEFIFGKFVALRRVGQSLLVQRVGCESLTLS